MPICPFFCAMLAVDTESLLDMKCTYKSHHHHHVQGNSQETNGSTELWRRRTETMPFIRHGSPRHHLLTCVSFQTHLLEKSRNLHAVVIPTMTVNGDHHIFSVTQMKVSK